jgi:hypothetical protein
MPYVAILRNNNGLGASVHPTEAEAQESLVDSFVQACFEGVTDYGSLADLPGDQEAWEAEVHLLSLNLFNHVADHTLRLALITRDTSLADQARGLTFSAWWNDNNEGDRVAESLPPETYKIREDAIVAMGEDQGPLTEGNIPNGFWDAVTTYWVN